MRLIRVQILSVLILGVFGLSACKANGLTSIPNAARENSAQQVVTATTSNKEQVALPPSISLTTPAPTSPATPAISTTIAAPSSSIDVLPAPDTSIPDKQILNSLPNFGLIVANSDGFEPGTIHIAVGSAISWNKANHCDTDTNIIGDSGGFPGGLVTSEDPYTFYFAISGTYFYHMEGNPGLKGTVIVG